MTIEPTRPTLPPGSAPPALREFLDAYATLTAHQADAHARLAVTFRRVAWCSSVAVVGLTLVAVAYTLSAIDSHGWHRALNLACTALVLVGGVLFTLAARGQRAASAWARRLAAQCRAEADAARGGQPMTPPMTPP